jgi:DmsE family decaheme c-type cytochrome
MMAIKGMIGFLCAVALCWVIAGPAAAASEAPVKSQTAKPVLYAEKGADSCLKCHDEATVTDILKTPHAVKSDSRTPFAAHACESCHGASPDHMTTKGKNQVSPTVVFKGPNASPVEERNKACMGCHENGLRMGWAGSQHQDNEVDCASCHTIHTSKDPVLLKKSQSDTCFTCHAAQRAQSFQFSHHPIREGKVVCSDCHNPHGTSGPKLLKENSVNDTCYTCHTDKRGPFLWEHQPVREDCSVCHVPHGSNQTRLLKERPPFLCQTCHTGSGHFGSPYSASNLPGRNPDIVPALPANRSALSARILARGCVNCHSAIHGSNSPSGQFFNR